MQNRFLLPLVLGAGLLGLAACSSNGGGSSSDDQLVNDGSLTVATLTPEVALTSGNTNVLIRGTGFTPDTQVMFGDKPSTQVSFLSEEMLTALVPSHTEGTVDLTVTTATMQVRVYRGFTFYPVIPDDGTDSDGDGLTDVQESILGYPIKVDFLGLGLHPDHLVSFSVTSDPLDTDTDDDGLSDSEEAFAKTNPREVDTDLDGLWDYEEAKRWLTSPISVDTDGDARGPDDSSNFSTLPPVFDLFDGAELYTYEQLALPPNQRGDIKLNATSPTLDDTDGDNVRDFDEIDTPVRTPLFADMPQLVFEIVDDLDVRLDVEYAEEEGTTTAFETSYATSLSESTATSRSHSVSSSLTFGGEAGFEFNPFKLASASAHWEITTGYEHSWGTEKEVGSETESAFSQLEEKSRTFTETAATGSIVTGIEIRNEGNITVQVLDLGHTIRQWIPNNSADENDLVQGEFRTVGILAPDLGPGLTLGPGGSSGVIPITAEDVNADRIKDLLAQPDSLQLEPEAFELVNSDGFNYAFIEEVTGARTGRVTIDYGNGDFEEYRIATNVDRNEDGSYAGITMDRVMDLIVGPDGWEMSTLFNPCNETLIDNVLWRVRDVTGVNNGAERAYWTIVVSEDGEFIEKPFDEYVLRNGETILLSLIADLDGDGLIAPIEQHYGSSDELADTDGDGLSDPEEAVRNYFQQCDTRRGGWIVTVTGSDGTISSEWVFSDPSVTDSDGDGLTDGQEKYGWCDCQEAPGDPSHKPDVLNEADCLALSGTWRPTGTNPGSVDTDGDGRPDAADVAPLLEGGRLYVRSGSGGAGSSWDDAYGNLGSAMDAASAANGDADPANDIVEIWVAQGIYFLSSQQPVNGATIYGGFGGYETALGQRNPNGLSNGCEVRPASGSSRSIAFVSTAEMDCTFDGLAFTVGQPAFTLASDGDGATITLVNCFFNGNVSINSTGGAILARQVNLNLIDTTFFNNLSLFGGAVYFEGASSVDAKLNISGCTFDSNRIVMSPAIPTATGGALSILDSVTGTIEDTTFRGNSIYNNHNYNINNQEYRMLGGGVYVGGSSEMTITRCSFESNFIDQDFGSGVIAWTERFSGGGLCVDDSRVNVHNSVFADNQTYNFGGGISAIEGAFLNVMNSTFVDNLLNLYYDDASIELCTSELYIEPYALGAAVGSAGFVTISNCAFFGNGPADGDTSIGYGAIGNTDQLQLRIENTVSSPLGFLAPGCNPLATGFLTYSSSGFDDLGIQNFASTTIPGNNQGTSNLEAANMGFVSETNLRLSAGSPLIDMGSSFFDADIIEFGFQFLTGADRGGDDRIVDGDQDGDETIDIGAYEFQN